VATCIILPFRSGLDDLTVRGVDKAAIGSPVPHKHQAGQETENAAEDRSPV